MAVWMCVNVCMGFWLHKSYEAYNGDCITAPISMVTMAEQNKKVFFF